MDNNIGRPIWLKYSVCGIAVLLSSFIAPILTTGTALASANLPSKQPATAPYARRIDTSIPSGSQSIVIPIPGLQKDKTLYAKFVSIRVTTPSGSNRAVSAGIAYTSCFNAFQMQNQGVIATLQTFVATHPLSCTTKNIAGINEGIYVTRSHNAGTAFINIYLEGDIEL